MRILRRGYRLLPFRMLKHGRDSPQLYASHEQFPAALFQFLVHVENKGNRCHEIYCDTFSVNISAQVEEVAALFMVNVITASAGTPQYVETARRTIAGRLHAMLLGAPHLPR